MAARGRDAPFYLWEAGEEACDGPSTDLTSFPRITRLFRRVYRMLSDADDGRLLAVLDAASVTALRASW